MSDSVLVRLFEHNNSGDRESSRCSAAELMIVQIAQKNTPCILASRP